MTLSTPPQLTPSLMSLSDLANLDTDACDIAAAVNDSSPFAPEKYLFHLS